MRYTLFAALALIAIGCSSSTEPAPPVGVLIPLAPGNIWIGEWKEYDSAGTMMRSYSDTSSVVRDTVIDGERRALFNHQNGYVNRADGLYGWGLGTGNEPQIMFKYPTVPGEYIVATPYGSVNVRIVSTSETVTVRAGTFSCHHYMTSVDGYDRENHFFYAPNVGSVRFESIDRRHLARVYRAVFELNRYTLN